MKIYIAYKYSNNKDKEKLKIDLELLDKKIRSCGVETFILGRDIKNWRHVDLGYIKQIPVIYSNMAKCDMVVAYTNSGETSWGLIFELVISKVLNKKSVLLFQNYKASFVKLLTTKSFKINSLDDVAMDMLK